jgi:hypothetical protein
LSGRLTRRRLIRAGLIIIVPLAIEKIFEFFISPEGIESGRKVQEALLFAVEQFNFVQFIGRFFENFAAVPAVAGDIIYGMLGQNLITRVLLYVTIPFAWLFAFAWTPIDLLLHTGPLTLLIGILQIAAFWIAIDRSPPEGDAPRKPLLSLVREEKGFDRVMMALFLYLILMIGGTVVGAVLYMILAGGTLLFGWALQLAALFLFANTVVAFCYLFVMKYAEDKVKALAEAAIERGFGDGEPKI